MAEVSPDFSRIQGRARCPFAARSRLEAAPAFTGRDAGAAGLAAAPFLAEFTGRIDTDLLDGFIIELTDPRHGRCLDSVTEATRQVLAGILRGEGGVEERSLCDAGNENWWFRACGTRWFCLVFAPCYGPDSPRHTFGSASTFLVLQPVAAFDRHANPKGTVISEHVRARIREEYASSGRPYDSALAAQDVEALKFVWPLANGDPPVRWWPKPRAPALEEPW